MSAPELTQEQRDALVDFQTRHGWAWKAELKRLWASGQDEKQEDGALLRQVRNEIGPMGLDKLRL